MRTTHQPKRKLATTVWSVICWSFIVVWLDMIRAYKSIDWHTQKRNKQRTEALNDLTTGYSVFICDFLYDISVLPRSHKKKHAIVWIVRAKHIPPKPSTHTHTRTKIKFDIIQRYLSTSHIAFIYTSISYSQPISRCDLSTYCISCIYLYILYTYYNLHVCLYSH